MNTSQLTKYCISPGLKTKNLLTRFQGMYRTFEDYTPHCYQASHDERKFNGAFKTDAQFNEKIRRGEYSHKRQPKTNQDRTVQIHSVAKELNKDPEKAEEDAVQEEEEAEEGDPRQAADVPQVVNNSNDEKETLHNAPVSRERDDPPPYSEALAENPPSYASLLKFQD